MTSPRATTILPQLLSSTPVKEQTWEDFKSTDDQLPNLSHYIGDTTVESGLTDMSCSPLSDTRPAVAILPWLFPPTW